MVSTTSTHKTLEQSISDGPQWRNSVKADIVSTPGFNGQYLGKAPGILKLLELILAVTALALVASRAEVYRAREMDNPSVRYDTGKMPIHRYDGKHPDQHIVERLNVTDVSSFLGEHVLLGETYFLASHFAVITILVILLVSYLFHATSQIIVPKASTLENVANLVLALMLLAAGITEIVMTSLWRNDPDIYADSIEETGLNLDRQHYYRPLMTSEEFAMRIAAGVLAVVNGVLFFLSLSLSKKELEGPHDFVTERKVSGPEF